MLTFELCICSALSITDVGHAAGQANQENIDKEQEKLIDDIYNLGLDDRKQLASVLREEKTKALGVTSLTASSLKSSLPRGRALLHSHARKGEVASPASSPCGLPLPDMGLWACKVEEITAMFASESNMAKAHVHHIDQPDFQVTLLPVCAYPAPYARTESFACQYEDLGIRYAC